MSNLQEILKTESENTDKIHFYREGVFYKAYEKSAYLFVTHVKPFMVKKTVCEECESGSGFYRLSYQQSA